MMTCGLFQDGCFGRFFLLVIFVSCWAGSCLLAQPGQLDFRHYTVADGLPSSEVYTVLEDRDGFLWFGTDNGVARFDGYEFTVFGADDGLADMVVFTIIEDGDGKLWFSTYSGRIFYFEKGRFYPYEYNEVTTELKKTNYLVFLTDITPAGDMIFKAKPNKIVRVSPVGEVTILVDRYNSTPHHYLYQEDKVEGVQIQGSPYGYINPYPSIKATTNEGIELKVIGAEKAYPSREIYPSNTNSNFSIRYGSIWTRPITGEREAILTSTSELFIVPLDGGAVRQFPIQDRVINFTMPGFGERDYWAFLNRGRGLEHYVFLPGEELPQVASFLVGHSISSGIFDRKGGFWVTTLDAGIYFCPYPKQKLYLKDDLTQNSKSTSLALTGPSNFYAGYDDGSIYRYDEGDMGLWDILKSEVDTNTLMADIFYDSAHANVYSPHFSFDHPLKKNQKIGEKDIKRHTLITKKNDNFTYFNHFPESSPNKLFAARGLSFAVFDLTENSILTDSRSLGTKFRGGHVLGIDLEENMLLGTLQGLLEITTEGCTKANNRGVDELSERIVFIKHINDRALLFGTRGNGLIYQDRDTSYQIKESDGLASDNIRHLHKGKYGYFWVSTLNGFSKVKFSTDGLSYALRTFRTENGLPTNEVFQTDTWGDEIWLATSAGIVHFVEPPLDTISPKPTIREVRVNGVEMTVAAEYGLPAGKQDVSIRFGTINYFLGDQVRYRYRITPDAPWQYSTDRTVNYPSLGAGFYLFEVQSCNQDGFWSKRESVEIFIATPWYATWWAQGIGLLFFAGALSTYFLIRENRKKREQNFLLQINELEHAALHAQMNPHFVFNALNSIQNFVLENDAKQAATYLSRFARVIRQTLRSSVDGQHTLREEMDMLKTYLVLEKLRFKEGFSYELTVSPDLPLDAIKLPPLLIQPFVENAILHGLEGKRGGEINVAFTGSAEVLHVHIEDNGKGFDPTSAVKKESLGMDITQRRLSMMNKELKEKSGMNIEVIQDAQGQICGTRINLVINLKKGQARK